MQPKQIKTDTCENCGLEVGLFTVSGMFTQQTVQAWYHTGNQNKRCQLYAKPKGTNDKPE